MCEHSSRGSEDSIILASRRIADVLEARILHSRSLRRKLFLWLELPRMRALALVLSYTRRSKSRMMLEPKRSFPI